MTIAPCSLSALELFFCDFSAPRPRLASKLARVGSLELRVTRPCAPRHRGGRGREAARSQSRVYEFSAKSRLRVLRSHHQSQPRFSKTYSPVRARPVFDENTQGSSSGEVAIYEFSSRFAIFTAAIFKKHRIPNITAAIISKSQAG